MLLNFGFSLCAGGFSGMRGFYLLTDASAKDIARDRQNKPLSTVRLGTQSAGVRSDGSL